jgi:hypothetical protein
MREDVVVGGLVQRFSLESSGGSVTEIERFGNGTI